MNNCRTRGLVLSVNDHSESDKIATIYSPELGKVAGIAKGAKRSKKRFVNKLEEFSLLTILYNPPKREGLFFLQEAELENAFISLRREYKRYIAAAFIAELTLRFTREHDPDPDIFSLLIWAMEGLDTGRNSLEICALFLLRILGTAGYQPVLDQCGICSTSIKPGQHYFLHAGGGSLICRDCKNMTKSEGIAVSLQTLKFMDHAQRTELAHLDRLRLSKKNATEALMVLYRYTMHILQHEIHSWQQLKNILTT